MTQPLHILIIGAGLIGLSTADSLTSRGARVTLVEREDGPGQGSSFANSGMIHLSQARPWPVTVYGTLDPLRKPAGLGVAKAVHDLAVRSKPLILDTAARLALPIIERVPGCVQIFETDTAFEAARAGYADLGVSFIQTEVSGRPALHFPEDMSGNAHAYCLALAQDLVGRGVALHYNAKNLRLVQADGRMTGAQFDGAVIDADHIVLATGCHTANLAKTVSVRVPIIPLTGYAVNFAKPDVDLPVMPLMDAQTRSCLTVFDDHIRLSGTVGENSAQPLLLRWAVLAPEIMQAVGKPLSVWQGARPMTVGGRPFIGRTGVPGLWVNAGHGHMGWTLCAGAGDLMATQILDGASEARFDLPG